MHVLARLSIRTETGQVVFAQHATDMPMPAAGSMSTKSSIIPRTILDLALGIDVEESALFLVAGVEAGVEVAFRHLRHVVLVEEFAAIAFLAQRPKPMLAHDRLLFRLDVTEGTKLLVALSCRSENSISSKNVNKNLKNFSPELKKLQTAERDLSMPAKGSGSAPICSLSSCSILKKELSVFAIIKSILTSSIFPRLFGFVSSAGDLKSPRSLF
jgi:hypothetical protein